MTATVIQFPKRSKSTKAETAITDADVAAHLSGNVRALNKRKAARKAKRKPPVQVEVSCDNVPRGNGDLRGTSGVVTIDYRKGIAYTLTYDPHDVNTPNAIAPIVALEGNPETDSSFKVTTDEGTWRFSVDPDEDDEDEDEDSDDEDSE